VRTLRTTVANASPDRPSFLKLVRIVISKRTISSGMPKRKRFNGGAPGGTLHGTIIDGAAVLTATVKGEAADPLEVIELDEREQIASDGAPVQVNATVPLNPLIGVTCRTYVAGLPAFTVAVVEAPLAASIE
jgi:hypothetical protein